METFLIKNRAGHNLAACYDGSENPKRFIILVPGLGGNFNEPHLQIAREVLVERGFGVLAFDPYNTGKSGGNYSDITVSGYVSDLEDVAEWAKSQTWYREPFYLTGHSLGGITAGAYAEQNPNKVAGLILLSSVISGRLSCESEFYKDSVKAWQATGWTTDDIGEKLPWSHMEDRLRYDLVAGANRLVMSVLQIVGSLDEHCPLEHQRILYKAIPGKKKLLVVEGAEHCFEDKLPEFRAVLGEGVTEIL